MTGYKIQWYLFFKLDTGLRRYDQRGTPETSLSKQSERQGERVRLRHFGGIYLSPFFLCKPQIPSYFSQIAILLTISVAFLLACNANAQPETTMKNTEPGINSLEFELVVDGLEFPEGPAWDAETGTLYYSNCQGGWIGRYGQDGAEVFLRGTKDSKVFERTNGMAWGPDGLIYACEYGRGKILRFNREGQIEIYVKSYEEKPFNRPNDLAFDPAGNLFFTDPNKYTRDNPDGRVFRVSAEDRSVSKVAEGLGFPNGLAFSKDGKTLYVCESAFNRILKYQVEPDGALSEKSVLVDLPGGDPDGMNLDMEGKIIVAHFGGGAIYKISPVGGILEKIPTPGQKPSNVEFAGPDLKTLYITEDETNAIYKTRVEVPGLLIPPK
jgi:gluconolactonase